MTGEADRLDVVVRLAEDTERQAASALGAAQARLGEAKARLGSLESYLGEYSDRPELSGETRLRSLSDTRQFLAQLQRSVSAQARIVAQEESRVQAARAHWVSVRLKLDALRKVAAGRRDTARRQREQAEQQQMDDRPAALRPVSATGRS
jgi:flagellar export protein FliJ